MGELIFNPMTPEFLQDRYAFYSRFREGDPVHRTPQGSWFVTRFDDVAFVARDRRFGRDFGRAQTGYHGPDWAKEDSLRMLSKMLLFLDPPDHSRIRSLLAQAFSAKRVDALRGRIQAITDGLIDGVIQRGEMDIVSDFALRVPILVICDVLGVPDEDRDRFALTFRITNGLIEAVSMTREELDKANAQISFLENYFCRLFELRRREPKEDLISVLVQAEFEGSRLSNQELVANVILLFLAGYETTSNLIANSVLVLHQNSAQRLKLMGSPGLLPNAIDELLRYECPVQLTARQVLEDVTLGSKQLKAGDLVLACLGAANRDPAIYPDPDRVDIERQNIRHLSFGGGIHFCLGAQLSRIELECALGTLLRRLPSLKVDPHTSDWLPSFVWRGLRSLPAHWS
ncbi:MULTISPECIES: cytochrome P450 [unclassified Bradyrhizobium]|uniref:cytochrome P450 n=1 Tax=unclassified Bradyrhizobium TaxID=2631580 RepID=UPI0028EDBAE3|nr:MULTISPECIES: cytochrome P450 [unclassified Bradyrhizobium]